MRCLKCLNGLGGLKAGKQNTQSHTQVLGGNHRCREYELRRVTQVTHLHALGVIPCKALRGPWIQEGHLQLPLILARFDTNLNSACGGFDDIVPSGYLL